MGCIYNKCNLNSWGQGHVALIIYTYIGLYNTYIGLQYIIVNSSVFNWAKKTTENPRDSARPKSLFLFIDFPWKVCELFWNLERGVRMIKDLYIADSDLYKVSLKTEICS